MEPLIIGNANVVLSNGVAIVSNISVADGMIASVGKSLEGFAQASAIEADGLTVFPGFVDTHIHGAVGLDVNAADTDGLLEIAKFLAANGVTAWVPTLVPDSDENYRKVIAAIDRLMEIQGEMPIAQAVGVHYEGVFANEKMCGALRPEFFKSFTGEGTTSSPDHPVAPTTPSAKHVHPSSGRRGVASAPLLKPGGEPNPATHRQTGGELSEIPRLKRGVHMTTFAPEIDGGIELTRELVRQGWIASIGHTKADLAILDQAFAAGAKHLTHFYNAMTGLHHRDVGVVGWALANSGVTFDIIADGIHVHPKMLEFACRSKSPENVSLISDSVAPTGLGDGEYEIWGEQVSVINGRTKNERGSIAGSVITMHDAFLQMRSLGFSEVDAAKMTSTNPAKLLGLDDSHGEIEVGKRADLVGIRADGSIKFVIIGGEFVDL